MLARKHPSPEFDINERIEHLRAVSLFSDVEGDRQALEKISLILEDRLYMPGNTIITEGETGADMYLLIEGKASVYKSTVEGDRYKVAILDGAQRAFFGEGALMDTEARSATITADTSCRWLVLSRTALWEFSQQYPHWALPVLLRIARVVMGRLRKTNDDLSLLYNALVAEIRGR